MWAQARVLTLGLAAPFATLSSQTPALKRRQCSFDTSAAVLMVPAVVYLSDPVTLQTSTASKVERLLYAEAIARYFQRPAHLEIPFRPIVPVSKFGLRPDSLSFELGGPLLLPFNTLGHFEGVPAQALSSITAVNDALAAAVARLDSAESISIPHWLAENSSGPRRLNIGVSADLPEGAVRLMAMGIPILRADEGVGIKNIPKPAYPLSSQLREEGASVDLGYVVGENGRADVSTIEVLFVSVGTTRSVQLVAAPFVSSAIEAIKGGNFTPARVGGCPVRSHVFQRISFNIGHW